MHLSGKIGNRRLRSPAVLAACLGIVLVLAAGAVAIGIGLQNRGFEQGLDHWTAMTLNSNRDVVYGPGGTKGNQVPGCDAPDAYGICVVAGPDEFEVSDSGGTRTVTVSPLEGDRMLRLAGPFHDASEDQAREHIFQVSQEFIVDPSQPVVTLNYNMFTFDYSGFDELRLRVKVFDDDGALVNDVVQGGFGSGTDLKTTGWRGVKMDLSPFGGEQMVIQLEVQGTSDALFGTWGYFDAGTAPVPPVEPEGATGSAPPGVSVNKQVNESGLVSFTMSNTEIWEELGEEECLPFTIVLPINSGSSTLSNVTLTFQEQVESMVDLGGGLWEAAFCIEPFGGNGLLQLEYDATEEGVTQHFIVVIGQIVLIDPQGVVYDLAEFKQAKAKGATDQDARATAAIEGAVVRLQRETPPSSGTFLNVLSADPGIAPNVNPQITGVDGRYQWDVSEGRYRVLVTKGGYLPVTSKAVDIPPPVLDLHIAMTKPSGADPPQPGGSSSKGSGVAGAAAAAALAPRVTRGGSRKRCVAKARAAFRRKTRRAKRIAKRARGSKAAGRRRAARRLKRRAVKQRRVALRRCRSRA